MNQYFKEGINKGWKVAKLKYFLKIRNGKEIKNLIEGEREDAVDVYGSGGVFKKTDIHLYSGNSVLFGRKGTIGKPIYVRGKFWTVDTMYYTTFFNNMIPKWAYYLFSVFPWEAYTTKTALPSIVGTEIENSVWVIPPKNEQKLLIEFLDRKTSEIDTLISDKEKLIALLEEKRQAIITEAVTKGLDLNVEMKDSGVEWIGKIPEHWKVKKIKYLSKYVSSGKTPRGGGEVYSSDGIPFLRSMNIHFQGLKLNNLVYISEETDEEMTSSRVYKDDILLNITGASIGRSCRFAGELDKANVNQHVCIIRPNNQIISKYLEVAMKSNLVSYQIDISYNGSSREGLNFSQVKKIAIPIPPNEEELKKISDNVSEVIDEIDNAIIKIEDQINKIKEYRQALIYEAVTGKIDVQEMLKETEQEEVSSS